MPTDEEIGLFQRAHSLEAATRVRLQLPGSAGCSDSAPGPRYKGARFPTLAMGFSSSGGEEAGPFPHLGLGKNHLDFRAGTLPLGFADIS